MVRQPGAGMHQSHRLRAIASALIALCAAAASPGQSATQLAIAVADFDYTDTSGEVNDQGAAHRARVAQFADLVRQNLGAQGDYRVLPLDCPEHPCTPINMRPEAFIAAARRSGARFVVYGGIRKMSTLVQWGDFELLDLESEKLLLQRTVSFRGDNDEAFRRAAAFVGDTLREAMPKP
jgi:uncharacterized protein DUF2380